MNSDFTRFCYAVVEATVKCWEGELPSDGSDEVTLWPSSFSNCKTDFDRVCCLLALQPVNNFCLLPASRSPACRSSQKSDAQANKLRIQGNQAFHNNQISAALRLYSRALFYSFGGEEKALAFANRSCVLAKLQAHSAVVEDVEEAIKHGYPVDRQCKLRIRRAQSLLSLNRVVEAQNEFIAARKCLSSDSGSSKSGFSNLIAVGLRNCEACLSATNWNPITRPLPLYNKFPDPPTEWNREDPEEINSDTHCYEICHNSDAMGWHLIAKKPYRPGDFIFLDKPYARRLHRDRFHEHCYSCFRRSINLIPCRSCTEVGFCSVSCEANAWQPDWSSVFTSTEASAVNQNRPCHRFECGQLQRLSLDDYACWKSFKSKRTSSALPPIVNRFCKRLDQLSMDHCVGGPNVSLLSFACLARTPSDALINLVRGSVDATTSASLLPSTSPLVAISGQRRFPAFGLRTNDFTAVGWLTSNSDKRTLYDLWQRTVAAVFLTHCLAAGGYPVDLGANCLTNPAECPTLSNDSAVPASWIAACLLHLIQAVASNAHTISYPAYLSKPVVPDTLKDLTVKPAGTQLDSIFHSDVGSGLYPLSSLLNHSCNPNVYHICMADGVFALCALRAIMPNEVLYGNYGYHYATQSLSERQQSLLEQYHFICECEACSHNWLGANLFDRVHCSQCGQQITMAGLDNIVGCECPPSVQTSALFKYFALKRQLEAFRSNITSEYSEITFDQLPKTMLDKHIKQVSQLLGPGAFEDVIIRPSLAFDYMQELLKLLLDLRYGCCFSEPHGIRQVSNPH